MAGQSVTVPEPLPRSHYFLTVSRGSRMRTIAVRSIVVHLAAVALPLLLAVGLGSTLYLAVHDDLVASLMQRQGDLQYAYEDRIEGLRQDLERQSERGRAEQAKLDTRVHDLFARQARLESHAVTVAGLAEAVPRPQAPALPTEITGRIPAALPDALGYAASDKPRPMAEPPAGGPSGARPEDHAGLLDDANLPVGDRLSAVEMALNGVERGQAAELTRIGAAAWRRVARLRGLIEEAGLSPERYLTKGPGPSALGGPFVPLPDGPDGAFGRAVAELRAAAAAAAQLGGAVERLPLAAPLSGRQEVTSPFGARLDPFLGRPALHTGVDLREGYGTEIRATGAGRVAFAGTAGGYGNMVEVDHGDGVATRYAHMGATAVSEGQAVTRGTVLGAVGATGRATGPHLHYEVRIDGEPVDPMRFLAGAEHLAAGLDAP